MRPHLYLSADKPLPFEHLTTLKGASHRWAGHNQELHDSLSLYSLSWLRGSRGSLHFRDGVHWTISAHDPVLMHKVVKIFVEIFSQRLRETFRHCRLDRIITY